MPARTPGEQAPSEERVFSAGLFVVFVVIVVGVVVAAAVVVVVVVSVYETFPGTGFNSQLVARDSVELAYSMSGRGPIEGPCLSEGSELSDLP